MAGGGGVGGGGTGGGETGDGGTGGAVGAECSMFSDFHLIFIDFQAALAAPAARAARFSVFLN